MNKHPLITATLLLFFSLSFAQAPYLVKDINPGSGNSTGTLDIARYAIFNGALYFIADNGTSGEELWKTDGTAAGTVMVKDINSGGAAFAVTSAYSNYLVVSNGNLFFMADDGTNGMELWKSDGTAAGTVMVKDINPGAAGCVDFVYSAMIDFNGIVYFNADDGTNGTELWRSDGTNAGTYMVKDINAIANSHSYPNFFTISNGMLFFDANSGGGLNLWKTDGTAAGTVSVSGISMTAGPVFDRKIIDVNGTLLLDAGTSTGVTGLWKSDGTNAGTVLVKDINPATTECISEMTALNGNLFFIACDSISAEALWKSDGTAGGTVKIKDICPGNTFSYMDEFVNFNGTLFFGAEDTSNNGELWKSDGTAAGTVMVKDINPSGTSVPDFLTPVGNTLYFTAINGAFDYELWKSDGTAAGTVQVADINPTTGSYPYDLINVNGVLFFTADDGTNGRELWALNTTTGLEEVSKVQRVNVTIYPNPFSHSAYLRITETTKNESLRNYELRIYDVLGREVLELNNLVTDNSITINRNGLPDGIYLYKIARGNEIIASGKLAVGE